MTRPLAGFRVWSEAGNPLANARSRLVQPPVCVRMRSIVLPAVEANSVRSGRGMGMTHLAVTSGMMLLGHSEEMSQSLPMEERWD